MSELDEILSNAKAVRSGSGEGWSSFTYITDMKDDKKLIKALFLELIGNSELAIEDMPGLTNDNMARNGLRKELRKKVESL